MTWPVAPLSEVATIERDAVAASEIETGTFYVGLEHVDGSGALVGVTGVVAGVLASNKFRFGHNHILFGKLRPYLMKTARPEFDGICSTDIVPILPGPRVDRNYLFHYLRHPKVVEAAVLRSAGANLPRVGAKDIESFLVPLPPLEEQRRIADILDSADAIRRKRKEAIGLIEELLRSAFLEIFGDPLSNPKGWPVRPLGEILHAIESGWSPVCEARPAAEEEWGVLKLGAVTFGRYRQDENKALSTGTTPEPRLAVRNGDVLFTRKNTYEHIAACVFVAKTRPRLLLPDLIFRLVPSQGSGLRPEALWGLLSSERMRKEVQKLAGGTAGSMPNISKERLRGVMVPVPGLAQQEKFASVLKSAEQIRSASERAIAESETLFDSLMARAFSGNLRD